MLKIFFTYKQYTSHYIWNTEKKRRSALGNVVILILIIGIIALKLIWTHLFVI